jgi:hypothetical protein
MPRIFTDEQKEMICKYHAKGMRPIEIAKLVDISYISICHYIRLQILKIPYKKRKTKPITTELANIIFEEIQTLKTAEIMNKYGVTRYTVHNIKYKRNQKRSTTGDTNRVRSITKGIVNVNHVFVNTFRKTLANDDQVKTDFANKLPFYLIYKNYCQNHGSISYNTFYQTCRRIGYFKKVGTKRKGSDYYLKKLYQMKSNNNAKAD